MNKREFLKTSGAVLMGSLLPSAAKGAGDGSAGRTNWAGNYRYSTDQVFFPKAVEEVQKVVKSCTSLKALGTRHSFNNIADSTASQISVKNLNQMTLDPKAHTVVVGAGVSYGQLASYLHKNGYALHNLASLPHISVAGARSTGTHGSGMKNGNLATSVSGLELVTAEGELVTLSRERDGEQFQGAVIDLGALGVVTKVTLDVVPTFDVRQVVYENLPFEQLEHHLFDIFASAYSVSLFTDWQKHRVTQAWVKRKVEPGQPVEPPPEFYGATLATRKLHPLADHSAENCTEQLNIPGPWHERLPHFRVNFTPSSGAELQTEYFVPHNKAYQAILAVERLREDITPHLFISELRTIDADTLWMSPCYKRPGMTIHFTWKPEWPAVKQLLPRIEEQLMPFNARPHWAKLFTVPPGRLKGQYEKLADYQRLVKHYDPKGKFQNEFLRANLFS